MSRIWPDDASQGTTYIPCRIRSENRLSTSSSTPSATRRRWWWWKNKRRKRCGASRRKTMSELNATASSMRAAKKLHHRTLPVYREATSRDYSAAPPPTAPPRRGEVSSSASRHRHRKKSGWENIEREREKGIRCGMDYDGIRWQTEKLKKKRGERGVGNTTVGRMFLTYPRGMGLKYSV